MALLHVLWAFSLAVLAAPLQSITITVPDGTSNHGDPHLLCTPTKASDIASFFVGNYFAHLATIILMPGEAPIPVLLSMLSTLFYPVSGVRRGLEAIKRHAGLPKKTPAGLQKRTPLETALQAGALAEVVRTPDWKPQPNEHIRDIAGLPSPSVSDEEAKNQDAHRGRSITAHLHVMKITADCFVPATKAWSFGGRQVHGRCSLPPGYALAILPPNASVCHLSDETDVPENLHGGGLGDGPSNAPAWYELMRSRTRLRRTLLAAEEPLPASRDSAVHSVGISSSYSIMRGLVSIFQLVYASFTLYRTKGDQLNRYGYAAFGLTVTPYLVMSFVNLLGSLLTPSYPCVYLVQTSIMEEAELRESGSFDGIVGKVTDQSPPPKGPQRADSAAVSLIRKAYNQIIQTYTDMERAMFANLAMYSRIPLSFFDDASKVDAKRNGQLLWSVVAREDGELVFHQEEDPADVTGDSIYNAQVPCSATERKAIGQSGIMTVLCYLIGCFPFAIIGPLSRFEIGESTKAQRAWTMAWLAVGISLGAQCYELIESLSNSVASSNRNFNVFRVPLLNVSLFLCYGVATVGGMVVVGQMLMDYGSCVRLY